MTLKEKFQKITEILKPEQKRKLIFVCLAVGGIIIALILYATTKGGNKPVTLEKYVDKKRPIVIDGASMEKSLYNEANKRMGDADKKIEDMAKVIEELKTQKEKEKNIDDPAEPPDLAKQLMKQKLPSSAQSNGQGVQTPPFPPAGSGSAPLPAGVPSASSATAPANTKPEVYGDIEFVSQTIKKEDDASKKKEITKIYLPPSFMEATSLSGMYAPAIDGGKSSTMPVLLRIKNLAILPNYVKSDLKGCFIIGEAHGSLADERAHIRLNTLSCLTKGGQSVIDQKIKGYVVDEDGFVGLRGRVVSKMGAALARSLIAGFAVGFGDALNTTSITTNSSVLGTTQTLDTDKATTAGIGKGISTAAKDLQKFLLDLGKQATPVIEVGATRPLTVVISEGVDIEVKERPNTCIGGGKCGS